MDIASFKYIIKYKRRRRMHRCEIIIRNTLKKIKICSFIFN